MADFPPLGHVALTVKSADVSKPIVWALPGGTLIGIHEHPGKTPPDDTFSEHRLGLDHLSFHCDRRADLESWQAHLDQLGYKHGGIQDARYGSGLSFRDPDGNALEFFAPPNT